MKEFLDMGLREADRLEHLVENILIANRIRRSTLAVQLQAVDLGAFLEEYLRHRSALLPDGHAGVVVGGESPRGLMVLADSDKLRVVLENLTDNALKYGGDGEVRLNVRAGKGRVWLDVEDDGIGFDPSRVDDLFKGVQPVSLAETGLVHGTGLGLSIARKLTRAMGGELTATSAGPGQGSCFSVSLNRGEASL